MTIHAVDPLELLEYRPATGRRACHEAHDALREVDFNALLIDDLERVLEIKRELREMVCRYRQDTRAAERRREDRDA